MRAVVPSASRKGDSARQMAFSSKSTHSSRLQSNQRRRKEIAKSAQPADKNAQASRRSSSTSTADKKRTQDSNGYLFDFFISYKRDAETRCWIEKHFRPLLTLRVRQEIGREPRIFIDDRLEAGASWPVRLGENLGRSRVLITLWSKDYFSSDWCVLEMSHMLARHKQSNKQGAPARRGLVIPVVIHDGEEFPGSLCDIQRIDIQTCFNVRMAVDSRRAEDLDAILAKEAHAFAKAIEGAPTWQERWVTKAADEFFSQHFRSVPLEQRRLPRFTD